MSNPAEEIGADLKRYAAKMPWWGWFAVGGAGLGVVAYVRKHGATGATGVPASGVNPSTGATPEYQPPDGLAMSDLAGLPFDYYDWSAANVPGGQPLPTGPGVPTSSSGATTGTSGATSGTPSGTTSGTDVGNPAPPPPAPAPTPAPSTPTSPTEATYYHTVHAWPAWDSTLSGIAGHYGMSWQQLYTYGNDKQIIDDAAHAHGHYSQEYNWLFPGEQLQVPSAN